MSCLFALTSVMFVMISLFGAGLAESEHTVTLTLGPSEADIHLGNVKIVIPEGTFDQSVKHTITTYSSDNTHVGPMFHGQPQASNSTSKRSHSADCPYEWMVWCHWGSFVNWTTEGDTQQNAKRHHVDNTGAFNKPVTIRYYPTALVEQGEFWVGVDMYAPSRTGMIPAIEQVVPGGKSYVYFNVSKSGCYTASKLVYTPIKNCAACTVKMTKCLNFLALQHNATNVCSVTTPQLMDACNEGTAPISCQFLCQNGEVETIWHPLTDIMCSENAIHEHNYISGRLCHYYQQC